MSITLTERAAQEVKVFIQEQEMEEDQAMVRIRIVSGGCSGLDYDLKLDTEFDESNDNVTEQHGVKVVVDKKSDLYLDGTTIDFYESLGQRGFQFHNPNAKKTCGCGQSFHV